MRSFAFEGLGVDRLFGDLFRFALFNLALLHQLLLLSCGVSQHWRVAARTIHQGSPDVVYLGLVDHFSWGQLVLGHQLVNVLGSHDTLNFLQGDRLLQVVPKKKQQHEQSDQHDLGQRYSQQEPSCWLTETPRQRSSRPTPDKNQPSP